MEIIDLKEEEYYIEQYIDLRNSYSELLLTLPVNTTGTKEWLNNDDIEIRGLVQDYILLGVVILYLNKCGEIAFFVKDQNKGMGSKLVSIIEEVAKEKKLLSVWGWALEDNFIAQRVFEKNGFAKESISERRHKGKIRLGINYKKYLGF